ncbi:RNA polymerase sigma-70 factor, ECF subfamily [Sporobacter termitidis DSM 10068]|uniref:RNA polymerase sigma-70 factor, ECF subfamily n=1 Tax=Sporobacter termitidis DSM 10068 TaxID=1123282 RepID=A0A1M5ZGH8_9FIRM|nr:sigma-70 family RNA polymerase sigma factor [Sporobacter termitidis]SHI23284.1 RNA polymerase sigma-70 factor, ECF subfamily [Sporobacter termitidis DSM 10068]
MLNLEAFEENDDKNFLIDLYTTYYGFVKKTIYNIIKDKKDLEDLIDDAFLKLIEKVSLLRTLNNYRTSTYIYYTAKSIAINYIVRRDVENRFRFLGADEDLSEHFISREYGMEDRILYQSELESLGNAIMKLPQDQQDLLNYKYLLNMNDAEIGELMGIEGSSVRQYLTRARRSAKKLIEKEMSPHDKQ